jgi:hypothetical protein
MQDIQIKVSDFYGRVRLSAGEKMIKFEEFRARA